MPVITRFAPSPTGYLHLGHAYSVLVAYQAACKVGGQFLLRIEDIDRGRCRTEFEAAIFEDLAWLGLSWEAPVRRQSEHLADYQAALDTLRSADLIYPCFCTRQDILTEIARAAASPHGPDGAVYPGTCRRLPASERNRRANTGEPHALRLDMARAVEEAGTLNWYDRRRGEITAEAAIFGAVVLARKDIPTSYHLAVTLADHLQDVSLVTRGEDLFAATKLHRLLQELLGLNTPEYAHHKLIRDASGRRFAKRDRAVTLQELRVAGHAPDGLWALLSDSTALSDFMASL